MRIDARAGERGFTIVEVMVAIVVTSIVVFGVAGAVLAAMHAQTNAEVRASLDDDALAVLSDVRMMTAYDPAMLRRLERQRAMMTRTLPSGDVETISIAVSGTAGTPGVVDSTEVATATASALSLSAVERIALYEHAPAPGSVVNQQ